MKSMTLSDSDVTVHLIGPGFGECAIVTIGDRVMIGIDCCSVAVAKSRDGSSYVKKVMDGLKNNSEVHWILTHYHYDHFQGLDMLLEENVSRIRRLLIPEDYTSTDMYLSMIRDTEEDTKSRIEGSIAGRTYKKVREILKRPEWANKVTRAAPHYRLLDMAVRVGTGSRRLRVDVLGSPVVDQDQSRAVELAKVVKGIPPSRAIANEGSYIVQITCGGSCALFLGDAPSWRLERLLSTGRDGASGGLRTLRYLKVAHHGSADGMSKALGCALREFIVEGGEAVASITPFANHRLPDEETIRILRDLGFQVVMSDRDGSFRGSEERDAATDFADGSMGALRRVQSLQSWRSAVCVSRYH